jgi:PBP1b-binding outer membrane lipoprotein LpoB
MATNKKAQTGGTYYATSEGRVGRLSGSSIGDVLADIRNESIDTTGYSKGKKEFKKIRNSSAEGKTVKKVKREEVKKVISDLKKGATQKMDLRTTNQRKKSKMRNGGSLSGLKASAKRVGPVDPKGAFTKVQKKTLKGAKGKASLTKDKQLGATKMKMGGKMKKC